MHHKIMHRWGASICFLNVIVCTDSWIILDATHEVVGCSTSKLDADCGAGNILLVKSASFGFPKNNTCQIPHNALYPGGCNNPVTHILEKSCTGRSRCLYPANSFIPTPELESANKNCKTAFNLYLQMEYHCVNDSVQRDCTMKEPESSGYITPENRQCSNSTIRAQPEQTIQLEMLDLLANGRSSPHTCELYFTVTEPGRGQLAVCGQSARISVVYTSTTNSLSINLQSAATEDVKFVLKFTILGCPTYTVPEGARVVFQTRDVITVRCNQGNTQRTLNCESNEWTGEVLECGERFSTILVSVVMWVSLIVLGIAIVVVVVVVVCWRKRKSSMRVREASSVVEDSPGPVTNYRNDDAECEPYSITRVMEQPQVSTQTLSAATQTSTQSNNGCVAELRFHGDVDVIKNRDAEGRTCLVVVQAANDDSRALADTGMTDEYLTTSPGGQARCTSRIP